MLLLMLPSMAGRVRGRAGQVPTRVEKWARSQQVDPGPTGTDIDDTLRGSVEPGVRS
jgi:hypothetical protein